MRFFVFLILGLSFSFAAFAEDEGRPLWDWGIGLGYVRYADYPASDEYSQLMLPFPTFQYRGEYLRADDREGGRAYLLKSDGWSLEFSGSGRFPLDSSKNKARFGMEDLPLVLNGGPQLVYDSGGTWEFQMATFFSAAFRNDYIRENGMLLKAQVVYRWVGETRGPYDTQILITGTTALEANAASNQYMETYYEVDSGDVRAGRSEYAAQAGFLNTNLSYYQRFASGRSSLYIGASISDYSWSANRSSPLHKSDYNIGWGLGYMYQFGESSKPSVSPEDTQGVINRYRQHRRDQRLIPLD
ncbi:MipA/OmpV family protein [Bdellovibrio sp. HCB274]|uniref:MipA/OmpV family protein n=1 Tax=Bdellovibrio sp. HCB274 TaxID=3394361 RepID=UPI0039B4FE0A